MIQLLILLNLKLKKLKGIELTIINPQMVVRKTIHKKPMIIQSNTGGMNSEILKNKRNMIIISQKNIRMKKNQIKKLKMMKQKMKIINEMNEKIKIIKNEI